MMKSAFVASQPNEMRYPPVCHSTCDQFKMMPKKMATALLMLACLIGCGKVVQVPANLTPVFDPDQELVPNHRRKAKTFRRRFPKRRSGHR